MTLSRLGIVAFLLLSLTSCALKHAAAHVVGSMGWDGQYILEQESDVDLARETIPSLITALSVLGASKPTDRDVASLLAKAYGQYAYGFYEEDILRFAPQSAEYTTSFSRADRFYRRGMEYGIGGLTRRSGFQKSLSGSQATFERELRSFGKKDVPLLFWTAFCWGGWINLHRDDPQALVDFPRVVALIDRVLELDRHFSHGAALSYKAVLDASRSVMLGGNHTRAQKLFEEALTFSPNFLMTRVLYAQYYAVQVQDQKLFEKLLGDVLAADAARLPEERMANELAKRRATLLLAKEKQWF